MPLNTRLSNLHSSEPGKLYIVATPIGNLGDMTERAIATLKSVQLIAAEDTRHSKPLLQHFAIETPLISVHDFNERQITEKIIHKLLAGASVALISDAGTPLISDPGYHLVRAAQQENIQVIPIPGSVAAITALSASGLPSDSFYFGGFLPAKNNERNEFLKQLKDFTSTLIFYEAPHRIKEAVESLITVFGEEREAVIARELTKKFETIKRDTLQNLLTFLNADPNQQRGEFVLLVTGAPKKTKVLDAEVIKIIEVLLEHHSPSQTAAIAAKITGLRKNFLYQEILKGVE
jgi:16S rRNA (cytidine1402-2'-O)-methyltransferase